MSLRIGDKVVIMTKTYNHNQLDLKEGRNGKVLDLKWNLIFIEFENGECDWVENRNVRLKSEK